MRSRAIRVWHLLQLHLAEAVHERVVWGLGGAAAALVLAAGILRDLNFGGAEAHFFLSAARVTLGLTGTMLAALLPPILLGIGEGRRFSTVLFVRGVGRGEWLAAAFFSVVVTLGWLLAVIAIALAWVLAANGHVADVAWSCRILAAGAGPLVILAAAGILFSSIFERAVPASAATFVFAAAGQLSGALDHLQAGGGASAVAARLIVRVVPDLPALNSASPGAAIVQVGGFVGLYVAAAMLFFQRREL